MPLQIFFLSNKTIFILTFRSLSIRDHRQKNLLILFPVLGTVSNSCANKTVAELEAALLLDLCFVLVLVLSWISDSLSAIK